AYGTRSPVTVPRTPPTSRHASLGRHSCSTKEEKRRGPDARRNGRAAPESLATGRTSYRVSSHCASTPTRSVPCAPARESSPAAPRSRSALSRVTGALSGSHVAPAPALASQARSASPVRASSGWRQVAPRVDVFHSNELRRVVATALLGAKP